MKIKRKIKNIVKRIIGRENFHTAHSEYVVKVTDSNKRFEGKVALVTGGSGEIGRAICVRLAVEGATVYVGGRSKKTTEKVAFEISQLNAVANPQIIDVANEASVTSAFADIISREDRIDILVNCAGGSTRNKNAYLYEQSIEMIDSMLNINLRGSMLCSREAARHMVKQKCGRIVNIASIIGLRGKSKFTDYAASKAGIIGYTSSLAIELGEHGVNVNCVSPGFIQRGLYSDKQIPYLLNSNYLKKIGSPEDIACAVAFLASSEANFITGQNLCVDGGRSLGLHGDN